MRAILKKIDILKILTLLFVAVIMYTYFFKNIRCDEFFLNTDLYFEQLYNNRNIAGAILLFIIIANAIRYKYNLLKIFIIIFFLVYSVFITFNSEAGDVILNFEAELFYFTLIIIACGEIEYSTLIKFCLAVFLSFCIIILIQTLLNRIILPISSQNMRVRYNLGYGEKNVTIFSYIWLYTCIYYIYVKKHNITNIELALLFFINIIVFYLTNTKSSLFFVLLLLIITCIIKYVPEARKYYKLYDYASVLLPILVNISLFLLIVFFQPNGVFLMLDKILSSRLSLAQKAIQNFGFTPFGSIVEFNKLEYDVVDSSFLRFLLVYGFVSFILLICILVYFARLINIKKDVFLFIIFVLTTIHMTFNLDLFTMRYYYLLFVLSYEKETKMINVF